ncbi:MAG: DsbC family protein, partial [Nitrospirales bacterium]|nr:DsbC family protein [Nitrospirales bacterium]
KHLVSGSILEIATGSNKTVERVEEIQVAKKVDLSAIPLSDSLVMGDPQAPKKVFVFTDPDCPYCGRLHGELTKILQQRKDIVFYIKLYPLPMHKDSGWKSKSIMCNNSLQMLEDNFNKKPIPKTECDTKAVDNTMKIVESLGISGTPTLVFPDGTIQVGAFGSDKILQFIDNPKK